MTEACLHDDRARFAFGHEAGKPFSHPRRSASMGLRDFIKLGKCHLGTKHQLRVRAYTLIISHGLTGV